jgi:hypothetical protein
MSSYRATDNGWPHFRLLVLPVLNRSSARRLLGQWNFMKTTLQVLESRVQPFRIAMLVKCQAFIFAEVKR